jgi:hypothetical protein
MQTRYSSLLIAVCLALAALISVGNSLGGG